MSPDVLIRRIRPDDGELLRSVRLRALQSDPASFGSTYEREAAYDHAEWESWASEDSQGDTGATLLALGDAGPLGMVMGAKDDEGLFHVFGMWVAPEARGQGLGRRLLTEIEEWMVASGGTAVQLSVTSEAPVARRLYESAGYAPDGTVEESLHTPGVLHVSLRKRLAD